MYSLSLLFHNRLMRGEKPIRYVMIHTHLGWRVYGEKAPSGIFGASVAIADGTFLADGTIIAGGGSVGTIGQGAYVLDMGSFERTLQPLSDNVLTALGSRQLQHINIELDNTDGHFSRIIPGEPFLGRPLNYYVGFEQDPQGEHLSIFRGIITELNMMPVMTIEADER